MSLWSWAKKLLTTEDPRSSAAVAEDFLIRSLVELVNATDEIDEELDRYRKINSLSPEARQATYASLYFHLEDFIVGKKFPTVKREFISKEVLRAFLAEKVNVSGLSHSLRFVFLPEPQGTLSFFDFATAPVIRFAYENFGETILRSGLQEIIQSTPFEVTGLAGKTLDLQIAQGAQTQPSVDDITRVYKKLYGFVLGETSKNFGEKTAENLARTTFTLLVKNYDRDFISKFISIVPNDILSEERVSFLSREELERKVLEATSKEREEKAVVEELVRVRTKELQQEQAYLYAAINSLSLGFMATDSNGTIALMNKAAKNFLATDPKTFAEFTANFAAAADLIEYHRRVIADKKNYSIPEVAFRDTFFKVLFAPILLKESDDAIIGSVVLLEDISEQKALEQSKNTFLAIASHEMRTPLAIIRSNAELMQEEKPVVESAGTKEEVERILKGSVRLLGIVNDFLDVQRLEGNNVSLDSVEVDLTQLLDETVGEFSKMADSKHIGLLLKKSAASLPLLKLDRSRLQQIFTNLIGNAIHYTNQGGVTVRVESDDATIRVYVEDTGAGMDAEDQKRLFQKFQTGKIFLKSREYGSGLGLYISRLLAGLMGLTVGLEKSELGHGSVFSVTIPIPKV